MSVQLMFPKFVFTRNFLGRDSHKEPSMTAEYFDILKNDIDAMRVRDPIGRQVSNTGGWQSKDGCESSPAFVKCMRAITRTVRDEMMPFLGLQPKTFRIEMHNSWANINHTGTWNRPHLHNGCFYSGVLYIKADGDEGNINFIDSNMPIVGSFPHAPKIRESFQHSPRTGDLHLFPSGLMHMVEPNTSDKDRYSISFNLGVNVDSDINNRNDNIFKEGEEYNHNLLFDIDADGKLII